MRRTSIFRKTLGDQRWQIFGYGLAMAAMASTSVWLWPSVRDTLQTFEIPAALKALLGRDVDFTTAAGYLSGRYFSWTIILLVVYAVVAGTGAIAGEENSGTIDLLLAQPVTRTSVLLQKLAAATAGVIIIAMSGYVGFLISVPTVSIAVSLGDLAIACGNMIPVSFFFLAMALWCGVVAPNRGAAAGMAIGVTVVTYFLYTLSNGVDSLERLQYASPFYYYGSGLSLTQGIVWWHVGTLLAVAALFCALSLRTFDRRDISPGGASDVSAGAMLRRALAIHP
ncbi:MAG TPA: ABC transporter permease subunit [Dehalococcoidia bacterium]|jgi:ABC-2 type transport system permease protein